MITDEQRRGRRTALWATDVAAVLGLDPWRSPWDIWAEKTGRLSAEPQPTPEMLAGLRLEGAILDEAEALVGPLDRAAPEWRHATLPLGAHPDAICCATGQPVEAKTSGLFGPLRGSWGEPWSDQVPEHYIVQVTVQLMCAPTPVESGLLMALLGGRGFVPYIIPLSTRLADVIAARISAWWEAHVVRDTAPAEAAPDLDVLRAIRREPGRAVDVPPELVERWREARATTRAARAMEERAAAELLAAMGDAEIARAGGRDACAVRERTIRRVDVARLRREQPQTAQAYLVGSTYRVLVDLEAQQKGEEDDEHET